MQKYNQLEQQHGSAFRGRLLPSQRGSIHANIHTSHWWHHEGRPATVVDIHQKSPHLTFRQ